MERVGGALLTSQWIVAAAVTPINHESPHSARVGSLGRSGVRHQRFVMRSWFAMVWPYSSS